MPLGAPNDASVLLMLSCCFTRKPTSLTLFRRGFARLFVPCSGVCLLMLTCVASGLLGDALRSVVRPTLAVLCRFRGHLFRSFSGAGLLLSRSDHPVVIWRSSHLHLLTLLTNCVRPPDCGAGAVLVGVEPAGVDRAATMYLRASLSELEQGFLHGMLVDAQWTASALPSKIPITTTGPALIWQSFRLSILSCFP